MRRSMSKMSWIPEPPKTEAEIREAVEESARAFKLQVLLVVAAAVLYVLFTSPYDLDDAFTLYGRDNDVTGLFERIDHEYVEQADELQDHPIVWFVGASIVKQAFDEDTLNQGLADAGSPWRVRKHGFARGAPILAAGMIEQLPVKPGDLVVGAAWFSNFRDDWMKDNDSAEALIPFLMSCSQILHLSDILPQERLELCMNHPRNFFLIRDEWNRGLRRTWNHQVLGYNAPKEQVVPKLNRGKHPKRFTREDGFRGGGPQVEGPLVFDDDQVNVLGLRRMREAALGAGAGFTVLQLPVHSACEAERMIPEALAQWSAYGGPDGIPFQVVPGTWPDELFFDYQHFNSDGRDVFLQWLLPLIAQDQVPAELPPGWTGPALPRPEGL
jgi:hypothetical protein